jgi:hypothetical protein
VDVKKQRLFALEELHGTFVALCGRSGRERTEVAASAGFRILFSRIQAVFT